MFSVRYVVISKTNLRTLHLHLSLNRMGRWGTTDDFTGERQVCPFPDVVFLPLLLSAFSSSPSHCALQDGFGQT